MTDYRRAARRAIANAMPPTEAEIEYAHRHYPPPAVQDGAAERWLIIEDDPAAAALCERVYRRLPDMKIIHITRHSDTP